MFPLYLLVNNLAAFDPQLCPYTITGRSLICVAKSRASCSCLCPKINVSSGYLEIKISLDLSFC